MGCVILIQGALTNVKGAVATGEFIRYLAGRAPACHYFMVEPPPGISMTAAIDWRVVLPEPSAVSELATALWDGYEAFILPLHAKESHAAAGITVQIKNEQGAFDQFLIGRDIADKEAFLHRVKESSRVLFPRANAGDHAREIEETQQSGYWVELTGM